MTMNPAPCLIDRCGRETRRWNQLCSSHNATAWRYGIEPFDLQLLLRGDCMIVGCHEPATTIDHDHAHHGTDIRQQRSCRECVRGAVCMRCNLWIGVVERGGPGHNIPDLQRERIGLYLAA
ncbi:hypothetical protein SEA_NIKE_1 [Microbacterium phage Nike]|nr:hypothetical protein SEA_NIKE_1 [Microbacterium phage Nike]